MQPDLDPIRTAEVDWQQGRPFSSAYGDAYFSRQGGIEESRAVFIDGNHLAGRFTALPAEGLFTIGETGFGTGLNLLLAAECFQRHAPPSARLAMVSAELHPLALEDLAHSLELLELKGDAAARLIAQYPSPAPGFHRLKLADNVELTLMFGDALEMWRLQAASVDAWFLDGFAPDRNQAMWQPALLRELAGHSRPGATLATFTVAGKVRRALAEAGFEPEKKPGFGRKRERLEGHLPGRWTARRQRTGHALVIGAGLAGATTARALAERGWTVEVLERSAVASGASGNRAGVVYTTPSGTATPQNRFYQSSYLHALRWLHRIGREPEMAYLNGVVQHLVDPRQHNRMESALTSGHWPERELVRIDDHSVLLTGGGCIRPAAWCSRLLDHPGIKLRLQAVRRLLPDGCIELDSGRRETADAVLICTAAPLAGLPRLPLRAIRGQVTECRATPASSGWHRAECHTGYLTPAIDGIHCIGATFDPHDLDPLPRDADDERNLVRLRRHLPARWTALGGTDAEVVGRRVGFRWQARDYLPVIGSPAGAHNQAGAQVLVNLGHGSRGISGTPLCAELLADRLCGLPLPADARIISALEPIRFEGLTRSPGQPR